MVRKELIKFIDGKERLGMVYDWKKIKHEFTKLDIPNDCFNPCTAPIEHCDILTYISKRSKGKTTNWILIGMIMYLMYGTTIQYVRTDKDKIRPSIVEEIFKVIKGYDNGKYIRTLTGGLYNSVYYHWGKCFLCHIDEDGKRDITDTEPFFFFMAIDKHEDYKSGFNAPRGDLIILDEFIEDCPSITDGPNFWDLFRTIGRDRLSPKVILLANTTDPNNIWFRELCISKDAKEIKPGEHREIDVNGSKFYLEYIDFKITTAVKQLISKYFGFAKGNPRYAHLIDSDTAWSFKPVPHIIHDDQDQYLDRTLRLIYNNETIQLDIVKNKQGMIVIYAHPCYYSYSDSVFLTLEDIREPNYYWGLGHGKYFDFIWKLYQRNLWFFSDNETGAVVDSYVKSYRQLRK